MEQISFLQKLFSRKKADKKSNWLFYIGIAGIVLIFISSFWPQQKSKETQKSNQTALQLEQEYISELETKLTSILSKTNGVGNVQVMITLESSAAVIYAQNEESDTEIQDNGQEDSLQKNAYKTEHVIIENSGQKNPLIETSIAPEIKGVAIVCTGGGDISVIKNVTDLVSALLALPTNRICVTQMI